MATKETTVKDILGNQHDLCVRLGVIANFEDHGTFYANQRMVNSKLALSLNSGIIYDISNANNVMRVSMLSASNPFIEEAQQDIDADGSCWYGTATVMTENDTLIWEY